MSGIVVGFCIKQFERVAYSVLPRVGDYLRLRLLTPQQTEHDRRIFAESDALMPESQLADYMVRLASDVPFDGSLAHMTRQFMWFFSEEGHQYLTPVLRRLCLTLCGALDQLDESVAGHTFPLRNRPGEYGLYPEFKDEYPQGEAVFLAALAEVRERVKVVNDAYRLYRAQIKRRLIV